MTTTFSQEGGTLRSHAAQILAALRVQGLGPVKVNTLVRLAFERSVDLAEFVAHGDRGISRLTRLQAAKFDELLRDSTDEIVDFESEGGSAVGVADPRYPAHLKSRLGDHAPPLLFARGNLEWFSSTSVGFCGSRNASPVGLSVAQDIAGQLAADGVVVVSGYAAGVDMAVHVAALDAGSATIVVLAEGIKRFRIKTAYQDVWDWGRVLVVSEFLPGLPWSVRHAMHRNGTIAALSDAMVLIEARSTGGSIAAGRTSLEHRIPLFAPVYRGMPEWATGNRLVLEEGAEPVLRERATARAHVAPIRDAIDRSYRGRAIQHDHLQLSVFERPVHPYRKKGK